MDNIIDKVYKVQCKLFQEVLLKGKGLDDQFLQSELATTGYYTEKNPLKYVCTLIIASDNI